MYEGGILWEKNFFIFIFYYVLPHTLSKSILKTETRENQKYSIYNKSFLKTETRIISNQF
jgi:hypothetical protein